MPPNWKHVLPVEVIPLTGDGTKVLHDDGVYRAVSGGGLHAATHATGQSDPVSPASIGAATQVGLDAVQTDLDALSDLVTDHIAVAALDTEVTAAIAAHEAAANPHPQYASGGQAFPVGSVFLSVVSTNPATLLGYGTWQAFGAGRMLVGVDSGDPDFDTAEEVGGSKTVTLTTSQMPAHSHGLQRYPTTSGPNSGFTADTSMNGTPSAVTLTTQVAGSGQAFSVMNPFIAVHLWKRTA